MTDARIPDRWLNDRRIYRLDAESHRSFVNALLWSVANQTDGVVEPEDLPMIPHYQPTATEVLIEAGLLTALERGWLITDFAETQTSREELEALKQIRQNARARKARERAAKATGQSGVTGHVTRPVTGPSAGQHRTGQDRQGQDRQGHKTQPEEENAAELRTRAREELNANGNHTESPVTKPQLQKLSILRQNAGYPSDDDGRLDWFAWVETEIGRLVGSNKELTKAEASSLIDVLEFGK